jgi:hypothetical protein
MFKGDVTFFNLPDFVPRVTDSVEEPAIAAGKMQTKKSRIVG